MKIKDQSSKSKKGFAPILIIVLAAVLAVGGVGIGLAWKTEVLDKILPPNIKEFLGKEVTTDGTPTNGEQPATDGEEQPTGEGTETTVDDQTKDWETYTNDPFKYSVKYEPGWWYRDITNQIQGTSPTSLSFIGFYLLGHGEDTVAYVEILEEDFDPYVGDYRTRSKSGGEYVSESERTVGSFRSIEVTQKNVYTGEESRVLFINRGGVTVVVIGSDDFRKSFRFLD